MTRLKSLLMFGCFLLCLATILFVLLANTKLRVTAEHIKVELDSVISIEQRQNNIWNISDKGPISPSLYYCNFPSANDEFTAEEGKPPKSSWVLKQIQVVIRHGDRSPIGFELYKKLKVRPDYCQLRPNHQPSHPSLKQFRKTISLDHTRLIMQGRKLITSPFPRSEICGSATLSQLGVVQHIHNGEILRKMYIQNHNLLAEAIKNKAEIANKILVVSTTRSRTVQSAIAFLYGLIPDFHLDQVDIKYSNSDIFSMKKCPAVSLLEQNIKNMRYKIYIEHQKKNSTFRKLADGFGINDHSGVLIDSFVTGFLCKNYKLPCAGNQSCVTVKDLDVLLEEEEYMMKWPRLGTRLVFELWFDPDTNQHFVRILLNGKDYTMQTACCKTQEHHHDSSKVCNVNNFFSFVTSGIFKHFSAKTHDEACNTAPLFMN
uniref:2-phosphoxylose phosphatase 1-like isoform X2 n=1 Tax=Styela clava TaxID=7725 RepID=UPI00193A5D56|nr:2-phosphoxylose phosphatase 1-like isoform X2 [Styela clava]